MPRPSRGPWRLLCAILLLLTTQPWRATAQTSTPSAVTLAGLRTIAHQGGFPAAASLPDGTVLLLEDQGDGLRLLKADADLTHILAEIYQGSSGDHGLFLASDGQGGIYVGGTSTSGLLTGTAGAVFPQAVDSSLNSFVAHFDGNLHLTFLSFLGAARTELTGLAANSSAVFATGITYSTAFPATPTAFLPQPVPGNDGDGFVLSLSADGSRLRYASFLGGPGGSTSPAAIAVNAAGAAYIAGSTTAPEFPTVNSLQDTVPGPVAGFLLELNPAGDQLNFSTLVPGTGLASVALDASSGDLLATGNLDASRFPVANALAPVAATPYQSLLRLSADGKNLRDSVFLVPGTQSSVTSGLSGDIWVTGSLALPLAPQALAAGPGNAYLLHLDSADLPDTFIRFGGSPANHPAYASLAAAPGPVALTQDGTSLLVPGTLSAATDPLYAGTQIFSLPLTATTSLLNSNPTDLLPTSCSGSTGCSGTAGLLLRVDAGASAAHLAADLGDLPNVNVRNLGPQPAAGFTLSSSAGSFRTDCPATLAVGTQCGLVLAGAGPVTLTATLKNGPTLTLPVPAAATESAIPAALLFSTPELDFSLVTSSAPSTQTVTISNQGVTQQTFASAPDAFPAAAPYTLQEIASTCAGPPSAHLIAAGASCTLALALQASANPSGDSPVHAAWRIGTRDLSVTGFAQAASLTLSSTHLEFGPQPPGPAPLLRFLYLSNASSSALTHSPLTISPASPFAVDDDCPRILEPGSVCQIGILYNQPSAPALDSLTLPLDGGLSVLITGQTVASAEPTASTLQPSLFRVSPASVAFAASVPVSSVSSEDQAVLVTNVSNAPAALALSLLGDYTLTSSCPPVLPAQASCTLDLHFAPEQPGTREGLLTLSAGTRVLSTAVPISATASGLFDLPEAITFGETPVGEPVVQWFRLNGASNQPLSLTASGAGFGVALLPAFGSDHGTLGPAAFTSQVSGDCFHCWLAVNFSPLTAGASFGTLTMGTDPGGHPAHLSLSAVALAPEGPLLTPVQQDFGAIPVHSTSAPLVFTLTNALRDSRPLTIASVSVSGPFQLLPSSTAFSCAGTLSPTAACQLRLTFAPTADGPQQGLLTVTTDSGVLQTTLTGRGTFDPGLALSPVSLSFEADSQQSLTLTNTGQQPLRLGTPFSDSAAFTATSHCDTLQPAESCTVEVVRSAAAGTGTLNLPVLDTALGVTTRATYAVPLSADPSLSTGLDLFPREADFGVATTGSIGSSRQFTLTNASDTSLVLSFAASRNFPLSAPAGCTTLAPGARCDFSVLFLPQSSGALTGLLTIGVSTSKGLALPSLSLALRGYGVGSGALTLSAGASPSASLDFGSINPGQTATRSLVLSNESASPVHLRRFTTTYPFQAQVGCALTLLPGDTCPVSLTYLAGAPTIAQGAQADAGTLLIESDAAEGPSTAYLTGTTDPVASSQPAATTALPVFALSQTALTFPNTPIGQTAPAQSVVLTNNGTVAVQFAPPNPSIDFPVTTDCQRLAPGATCRLQIAFNPHAGSPDNSVRSAVLSLASDGASALDFLTLLGSTGDALTFSASSLQFGSVSVGTSAQATLTLTNDGLLPVTLSLAPPSGDFALLASTCPPQGLLAPRQTCVLTLGFTPTATGNREGQLEISSSGLAQAQIIPLAGVGIAGRLSMSPDLLDFGSVDLTASSSRTLTLANAGMAALQGIGVSLTGPDAESFTVAPCATTTLASSASCAVQVTFRPAHPGPNQATLIVTSSDPAGPGAVALTGTGALPPGYSFTVHGVSEATAQVIAGAASTFPLTAAAWGGFNTPLNLTCKALTAAPNTSCNLSTQQILFADGSAQATATLSTLSGLALNQPSSSALPSTLLACLLGSPWLLRRRRPGAMQQAKLSPFSILLAALVAVSALSGCGSGATGSRLPYTPPGTYIYQVTATPIAGPLGPASVTLTLKVY